MEKTPQLADIEDLLTIRDWLRYATSRFTEAGLVFGHGTETALDEAAFLILTALHLPIDQLEPWLEARLTISERRRLWEIVTARIETRKPAPYLVGAAWIRGHRFAVDERVIVPRSYIGELLDGGLSAVVADPDGVERVLDLCTGSGCLAVLMALTFPDASVDAADISAGALEVAAKNVSDYGLEDRVTLHRSDLFQGLQGATYDLIVSNPPYVTAAAVAAFPPEYAAEPELAHFGGADGLDLVRRILRDAPAHLAPGGVLIVEVGMARDLLETEYPDLPFLWLDTEQSDGEVFALSAEALTAR
ncbi:N5-glutamine S-adenosyl-L-methionine-dependent methyltransferase [Hyphomicrobium nitrativorans NL23]|uniref:Ribosomal protein uL3 glutamine methyltransferase n=1 Tax=Hyphomicrobium nitrativorans NL23 TaxID=1029756 RepID=V5SF87_9HYPH|nr:50S ribosomal protein L3 N(5)-glutamine methyltransferase [Hyphomicrobium nitrativorans]AHB49541.1 N5-glutamine S-adenosyl-L-methionine-dependent methyltransferase [Hyphomicrobium nitrativorans NL23]